MAMSDLTFHWSQVVIIPPRIKLGSMDLIRCLLKLESLHQALGQYLLQESRKSFCSQRPCVNRGCWKHFPAADSRCATWPRPSFMLGQDPMYTSELPPTPWVPWAENLDLLRVMLWSSQVPSLDYRGLQETLQSTSVPQFIHNSRCHYLYDQRSQLH